MKPKQAFVLFFVSLTCYLIFSLSFVSAYQLGELQNRRVKFIIDPFLKIIDDLKPINCESSGYITFRAYVENVPEFDIKGSEAFIEDLSNYETHNVTSSLSCFPKRNLISNQEITCSLKVNELLSRIPSCPFEKFENRFYLILEISYGGRDVKISTEKSFILTEPGTEPDLEVDFDVTTPSYDVPEINCRTGSEIEIPVVIKHAETLYGDVTWSFSVDGTDYGGNVIECEKILSREGEGKEDIYICTLVISSIAFTECEEGEEVMVWVQARTSDHGISGNFSTFLTSEELYLGLSVSEIGKIECQIIDEEGTCIPKEPQQNVTVMITGNPPQRLKVFETRYKLGDENITTTHCRKMRHNKYECLAFITIDTLQLPQSKEHRTTKSRELTVFFDVKYLNYYTNISDSTTVEMEGVILDEILNTMKVLEETKKLLDEIKDPIPKWLKTIMEWVDKISRCCALVHLKDQWEDVNIRLKDKVIGKLRAGFEKFVAVFEAVTGKDIWNFKKGIIRNAVNLIANYGPGVFACVCESGIKIIEEEQEKLLRFENDEISEPVYMPEKFSDFVWELIEDNALECLAEQFWPYWEWWEWLCKPLFFILKFTPLKGIIDTICKAMEYAQKLNEALNLYVGYLKALLIDSGYVQIKKDIALVRERINLYKKVDPIMTDYNEALQNTMETIIEGMIGNMLMSEVVGPQYDTVKLLFLSDRKGVLDNEDEICTNDMITIDYNFEKLNQTEGFVSRLSINPSRRGPLTFNDLKGTYGPYLTDTLLGTDPEVDPSEMYTFTLSYQNKRLDYELYYVNHTCI